MENSSRDGNTRPYLPASWETCMQVRNHQLEPDMEQQTGSKLGKECIKAVYCHPAYLTYMSGTSFKMTGWGKLKLESRLPGEISITSMCRWHHPHGKKQRGTKEPPEEGEKEKQKVGLKLNIQKTKIKMGKQHKQWQALFSWAPKSLWTVTAAVKLKYACFLEEKLWQT